MVTSMNEGVDSQDTLLALAILLFFFNSCNNKNFISAGLNCHTTKLRNKKNDIMRKAKGFSRQVMYIDSYTTQTF